MIRPTSLRVHPRKVREVFRAGNPGRWVHPEWEDRLRWLAQGTTGRGAGSAGGLSDFALFTDPPAAAASENWETLAESLGFPRIVHSRQVHGGEVLAHVEAGSPARSGGAFGPGGTRLEVAVDADGHLTRAPGLLLGVTVADCIPVSLVAPEERVVGILHAGWRGVVAGVLERGLGMLEAEMGIGPDRVELHLGPAICGRCYEVGPEVHEALGGPTPDGPLPMDLRGRLAALAVAAGVEEGKITQSMWCTRCEGSPFYSHRRGHSGRQVGFLGIRDRAEA